MSEKKRTIMLGFHSPVDGRLMREWVTGLGYEAVESLGDTAGIDLVLMDSVTARHLMDKAFGLKRAAKYFLPVLVCINAGENVGRWLKAGFDDVLRLPATRDEWRARIDTMLRLRRQSEELGHTSEMLHRALVESSSDQIFMLDANGTYVASNDRVEHFGLERGDELVGKTIDQVYPKEVAPFYRTQLQRVLTEGEPIVFEHDLPSDRAADHYHLDTLYPVNLPDGTVMVGGICRDITERKQAQEEARRAMQEWEKIFQAIGHPTLILSPQYTVWAANRAALKATGMTAEELAGKHCYEVFHGTSEPPEGCPMRELLRSGGLETAEMEMEALGGTFLVSCTPVFGAQGELEKVIHIATNVSDRVRAEEDRRVLETAIDNAIECIMVSDRENRLTYVNRAFEKLTGYSAAEAIGNTPGILKSGWHDRTFYRNLKTTIYAGLPWEGNITLRKKNGDYYDVYATITPVLDESGTPMHFVSVHRDVTKEREQERRFQQHQRLEAIGTLAGGIAHDFNNLLTPILGFTDLSIRALPPGSKTKDYLEQVLLAANRAKELVQQILSFSRRSSHERKPLRVAPIVKEALKLLRASIPSTIDIKKEIYATTEMAVADPTEIHQVMMNLCTNAYQAMPDGGVLTVTLKTVDLDSDTVAIIPNCKPGRHLKLSVEDTGQGIPPEIRDKIFEPYFTTKEEGRGTGLGLAVTHSIVAACGGGITVYSESGNGTRFNVYLPVAEASPTDAVEKRAVIRSGHERILFVDDEPAVVEFGQKMLEGYGYSVTIRMDPVQALALFKREPDAFDMVITDMTMPGMTGDQLAAALLNIRPDLPIIVCTGFSERMNKEKAQEVGIRGLLDKPFSPDILLSTIREIFDREE